MKDHESGLARSLNQPTRRHPRLKKLDRVLRTGVLSAVFLSLWGGVGRSDDLPEYLKVVGGTKPKSDQAIAEKNVLVLDAAMQHLYEDSLANFKNNFRAQRPIILALFTEEGGRMILDRPG